MDGLVAPEGTYSLTAAYVLPPQPSFMNTNTTATLGGGGGGTSALGTSSSSAPSSSMVAAGTNSASNQSTQQSQPAGGTTGAASGSNGQIAGGVQTASIASNGTSAGTTSDSVTGNEDGVDAGMTGPSEAVQPKTALHHISIHAPSAWSHVPIVPPSRISVASVRYLHGSGGGAGGATNMSSSISSLPSGLGGRKDRQQASHASTTQSGLGVPPVDGSVEGSNGSSSDLGAELSGSDAKITPASGRREHATQPHWGPMLEATLAAQGIDGTASHVTGGAGGLPGMAALQLLSHLGGATAGGIAAGGAQAGSGSGSNAVGGGAGAGVQATALSATVPTSSRNLPKPRNNIKQTSSSFVQRLQSHPDFAKLLASSRTDGTSIERHAFASRSRMFFWLAETGQGWLKEPLARLTFAAPITAHDVNQQTRAPNRLDVIIAFHSSDLIWLEAVSMRYSRLNKSGCVNDASITGVRWLPGSDTMLLTTHNDGTCTLFDVARDDSGVGSWTPVSGMSVDRDGGEEEQEEQEVLVPEGEGQVSTDEQHRRPRSSRSDPRSATVRAVHAWDPHASMLVTRPAATEGEAVRKAWSKMNPVAHWRVARSVSITDMAFSPDHTRLALVATDGALRLINLLTESLEGTFQSYYGAMNRVVWSPDAKFLLTAGCDDLISVWTNDGRLLSRCPGHASFVTGLAFDPWRWRIEDRTYRFISVGEDGRVFLWDFSSAALHRPRMPASSHSNRRSGGARTSTPSLAATAVDPYGRRLSSGAGAEPRNGHVPGRAVFRAASARNEVAELQPVASYQIGPIPAGTGYMDSVPGNHVPFAPSGQGAPSAGGAVGAVDGSGPVGSSATAAGGVGPAGQAGGSAGTAAASSSGAPAQGANAAAALAANSSTTPATGLGTTASGAASEPGSMHDLLVDVRCRPDGIVLLHKSGALRYLLRPAPATTATATAVMMHG